ncbi:MAG TPA: DUF3168 domain-containing protein [Candidatus Desulfobacillus denitrificans]|nr:DUF3168 domain-containing protein [Candidatus Desulfobacillus denitrificans]
MAAEDALYTLLSGAAGVTALVAARIYPDVLPEECAYPAIVFARQSTEPYLGIGNQVFGADVAVAIDCWAKTRTSADAVAAAVEAALSGSAFLRRGRNAAYDPETGLFATQIAVEYFET